MARGSFLWDADLEKWLPKHEVLARRAAKRVNKGSILPRPFVVGTMEPIRSMADGKIYDDKRSYYKSVARAGCEIIGYDKNWTDYIKPPTLSEREHEADIVGDVKRAIEEVSSK